MHSNVTISSTTQRGFNKAAVANEMIMNKVDANTITKSPRSRKSRLDSPTKSRLSSSSSDSKKAEKKSSKSSRSRSKSRSRKDKKQHRNKTNDEHHEQSLQEYAEQLTVEEYDSWDFGKPKTFKRPKPNSKNNKAATTINRMMRGWWARLHYKLILLQFKFENKDLLTQRALAKVKDKHVTKKEKVRRKLEDKHEKSLAKITKEQGAAQEAQKLIQQLRDDFAAAGVGIVVEPMDVVCFLLLSVYLSLMIISVTYLFSLAHHSRTQLEPLTS